VRRDQTATEWVLAAPLTGKSLQLTGKPLPLFLRLSKLAPGVETEAPGAVHLGKIGWLNECFPPTRGLLAVWEAAPRVLSFRTPPAIGRPGA